MMKTQSKNDKRFRISIEGIQDIQRSFKKLGMSAKNSRSNINKALRPSGEKLAKGMQKAYKKEFNATVGKPNRTRTWQTIGVYTSRRSRQPGLFVGPLLKKTTPITVKGKPSLNLPAMQIKGNARQEPTKDIFEETAKKMESQIYVSVEKALDRLLGKMLKNAGL